MKSNQYRIVLTMALLGGVIVMPQTIAAQSSGRFRGMDSNRDGVITRAEWPGNYGSFQQHDRNGDGKLSADEVRDDQDTGVVRDFSAVDLDGNGHVTAMEWRRAFNQLDVNRDGSLTADELGAARNDRRWSGGNNAPAVTRTFQAGSDRGLTARDECGIWMARGSWNRPTPAIPTTSVRATSTRPATATASGEAIPKGTVRAGKRCGARGRRI